LHGVNLIAQEIDNQSWYYTHNAHGDVVQRIRDNGEAAPVYHYNAFGNEKSSADTDPNPFRYCGEYWDKETESYYLRARSYSPKTGRFLTEDPIGEGLNWYAYCGNNPVMFVDPLGLDAILVNKRLDMAPNGPIDHMSAFFQDADDKWWYFSWEDSVRYHEVELNEKFASYDDIFSDIDSINAYALSQKWLKNENALFNSSVYVKGDFSASHEAAKVYKGGHNSEASSYKGDNVSNLEYNLVSNNCTQVAMGLFYKGSIADGTSVEKYINQRGYFSTSILPNNNLNLMQELFYNQATNLNGYNAAMQVQRNKYEGQGLFAQLFWLGLNVNVDRLA